MNPPGAADPRLPYLAMLTDGPTERKAAVADEHFACLQRLVTNGTVLMAGRTLTSDENAIGIAVFVAEAEAKAQELMRNDAAVREGVVRVELFPCRIALWSAGGPDGSGEVR